MPISNASKIKMLPRSRVVVDTSIFVNPDTQQLFGSDAGAAIHKAEKAIQSENLPENIRFLVSAANLKIAQFS